MLVDLAFIIVIWPSPLAAFLHVTAGIHLQTTVLNSSVLYTTCFFGKFKWGSIHSSSYDRNLFKLCCWDFLLLDELMLLAAAHLYTRLISLSTTNFYTKPKLSPLLLFPSSAVSITFDSLTISPRSTWFHFLFVSLSLINYSSIHQCCCCCCLYNDGPGLCVPGSIREPYIDANLLYIREICVIYLKVIYV